MSFVSNAFAKTSVLLVDDDTYLRKITRSLLMSFGVRRVYEAGDGAQGLEHLNQFRPDVVLLDWEMPMLNGAEMIRLVRNPRTSSNPMVPIVLITGYTERYRIQEALQLGVNEVLSKPFSAKGLLQRLNLVVNSPRPFVQQAGYFGPMPRDSHFAIQKQGAA